MALTGKGGPTFTLGESRWGGASAQRKGCQVLPEMATGCRGAYDHVGSLQLPPEPEPRGPDARLVLGAWGLQLCPFGHRPGPWVPGWLRREPRGFGCWTQRPLGRPAKLWEQRPKKDDFGDRVRTSGLGAEAGGQLGATRVLPSGCPLPGEQGIEGRGLPAAGRPLCKTWAPLVPVTHMDRRQQVKCPLPRQTPGSPQKQNQGQPAWQPDP